MIFGYGRKSKNSQKLHLQVDALLKYGIKEKNIYTDSISGSTHERKNLDLLISKLREGDTLVTWKLDRVGRSVPHLIKLINDFKNEGIDFVSIQEPFFDTTSPYGKFIFLMFSGIAELERDIIIERTLAGQESARKRGVKFGRKRGLTKETQKKAILAETYYRDETKNLSVKEICKLCNIGSKATLYRYLMYQGRRNCIVCDAYFWDKEQNPESALCETHKNDIEEKRILEKINN